MSTDVGPSRTRVAVYTVGPDGETDRFSSYATLIGPGVVALHPSSPRRGSTAPGQRIRVVLTGRQSTGVGPNGRLREVIDATVCRTLPGSPGHPMVASLDAASRAMVTPLPFEAALDEEPSAEHSERLSLVLTDFVEQMSVRDPRRAPRHAKPVEPDTVVRGPVDVPLGPAPRRRSAAKKPFWCWICHGAVGC